MSSFDAILERFYPVWFRYHPETAVDVGVGGHAERLRPFDDDDIGALTVLLEKLLDSLDTVDVAGLDADRRIDLELVRGAALLELKELVEQDWRRRDPTAFLPVHAIYQLTVREVADRPAALRARLGAIPAHLRGARGQLGRDPSRIPPLWLEAAVTEAASGAGYFRGLRHHPDCQRHRLDHELEEAARALEDFARYLERELAPRATGDFACGREAFELRLRHRHFLDLDADRLHNMGQRLMARTAVELRRVTRELRGDEDMAALTAALHRRHPPAEGLLNAYREGMQAARDFVAARELVSLPEREELRVVETPVFLRHQIPFAAYMEPQPRDPRQRGYYYVTPARDAAALGEHNVVGLRHTCVHEAWPGHHLQFVTANASPTASSLPRLLNPSATLYEGWALYCEQLMQEEGFLDAPESRFVLLKDRLWRALRVVLDVELHTRGLGVGEAAERMVAELGFTREQAMADLTWYTLSPTVPMGYATGWALLTETRNRLRGGDPAFQLRDFHDRVLASGSVALPLVLRRQFGTPLWESVRRAVFGED